MSRYSVLRAEHCLSKSQCMCTCCPSRIFLVLAPKCSPCNASRPNARRELSYLHRAMKPRANLHDANLPGANLHGAMKPRANLHGANLPGAKVKRCYEPRGSGRAVLPINRRSYPPQKRARHAREKTPAAATMLLFNSAASAESTGKNNLTNDSGISVDIGRSASS